jgi:alanine racemase
VAAWDRPFHLEIDTGMGRAGIRWDDERVAGLRSPHLEGVFTHLHSADASPESVEQQWTRFRAALARLPTRPKLVHAANSAGAWRLQQKLDLVRPGIFLYGGRLAPDLPEPRPVATVRARVVSLREIPAGESVSYGAAWRAARDTMVATLGIGYGDGIRRSVQNRGQVLLGDRRCPVIGRVTMDMVMVEAAARVGDVATLIGGDGDQSITLDEFASWAGTISYEVLTGLGQRLPRVYTE